MKIRESRKTENIRMEKNYRRNREYLCEVNLWKKKCGVKVEKKMEKRQIKKSGQIEEEKKIEGEKDPQKKQEKYDKLIREVTPTYCLPLNMFKAFLVGGSICTVGQILLNSGQALGLSKEDAGYWTSLFLILASVILTGLNIYPSFAKFGGADHRICQWCGIFCYRIQTGRTGVWYRLSDIRNCRTGNFVWDFYKLGVGSDLLDFKMPWDSLKMAENSQNLSYTDQIYSGLLKQLSGLFQHKKFGILLCI